MRKQSAKDGLRVMGIAGTHVVLLGWDADRDALIKRGVLGFAIQRRRQSDGETIWMTGLKTFKSVLPDPDPGVPVSSYKHPIQSFQWADYTVSPDQTYTYRVVARCGTPAALTDGPAVELELRTESVEQGKHAVFFNRGAVASQEYARRFSNKPPSEVGQPAYTWLSRGLLEGLIAFLDQAKDGDAIHGAFFEFKNTTVYDALERALSRGVSVAVLYDGDTQREGNEAALEGRTIAKYCTAREHSGQFAHNKFFVLVQGGAPAQVWTGSTNLSENGLFGHSNNAHLVRDRALADAYLAYWKELAKDQTRLPTAKVNDAATPAPPPAWTAEVVPVFSPQTTLDALQWYAQLAGKAQGALFATFAFGMNELFVPIYDRTDQVLRFALMEKKGNGRQYKQQAAQIDAIRKRPNTVVAVGNRIQLNTFDRWLAETDRVTDHEDVFYIHTKYMLVDPLGAEPIVIVGSANFSKASTDTNDENMLVIKGNPALADIYLGEFMRLFSHYAFREAAAFKRAPGVQYRPNYLVEEPRWVDGDKTPDSGYYEPGTDRALRRRYFAGPPA